MGLFDEWRPFLISCWQSVGRSYHTLILAFFYLLLCAYFDSARFTGIDPPGATGSSRGLYLVHVCLSIQSKGSNSVIRIYKQGRELEQSDLLGSRTQVPDSVFKSTGQTTVNKSASIRCIITKNDIVHRPL